VSCFFSLFTGNGPLAVNQEGNLELREMSWTKHHSMIYIDSPIGSGTELNSFLAYESRM